MLSASCEKKNITYGINRNFFVATGKHKLENAGGRRKNTMPHLQSRAVFVSFVLEQIRESYLQIIATRQVSDGIFSVIVAIKFSD